MDINFPSNVLSEIRKKKGEYIIALAKNQVNGIEDYRYRAGLIRGLVMAEEILIKTHEAMYEVKVITNAGEEVDVTRIK